MIILEFTKKKTSISNYIRPDVQIYKEVLSDTNKLSHIINNTYPEDQTLLATLAGDAAVMINGTNNSENLYCLQILPLDPKFKTTAVHFHIFPKGAAPKSLLELFHETMTKFEETKFCFLQ